MNITSEIFSAWFKAFFFTWIFIDDRGISDEGSFSFLFLIQNTVLMVDDECFQENGVSDKSDELKSMWESFVFRRNLNTRQQQQQQLVGNLPKHIGIKSDSFDKCLINHMWFIYWKMMFKSLFNEEKKNEKTDSKLKT